MQQQEMVRQWDKQDMLQVVEQDRLHDEQDRLNDEQDRLHDEQNGLQAMQMLQDERYRLQVE